MLRCSPQTRSDHGTDNDRCFSLPSKHITEFRSLIENLVKTDSHEIDEHEFCDWP